MAAWRSRAYGKGFGTGGEHGGGEQVAAKRAGGVFVLFAVLLALGGEIRQATDINLLLPFILTQAIFLRVLQYCDKRYCHWYDADRWQQVQNQSDDSFFLITRLMRREDKEHAD